MRTRVRKAFTLVEILIVVVILGILAATFVHLFAIVFTIIGHVLQPLRLHYAEFFTKFGFYEESGRPYKPFARVASVDLKNAGD